jgi:competence protein ComEA
MRVAGESLRERLASLSRGELVALLAVVAVTVVGAGLWYARSLPKPVAVRAAIPSPDATSASGATGASGAAGTATTILVDVAGWVRNPGVYEFRTGDRVVDAIDAAGGARPGALLASLNLAAPLTDGTQVLVPKEGATAAGSAPIAAGGSGAPGALVNVNTASATELEELPGVGEVIAQAIVDYRIENGPFTAIDQLVDVSGIGDATLENIRDLVTV